MKNIKIQSFSDIITNSSSELFVFASGKTVEEVIEQLDAIYPDWRNEYSEPISIENASDSEIEYYDDYGEGSSLYFEEQNRLGQIYGYPAVYSNKELYKTYDRTKSVYFDLAKKLDKEPEELYSNWNVYNPLAVWNNEEGYESNIVLSAKYYDIFRKNHKGQILLFSKDENPDWEYQEKLEDIATRYHLG